MTTGRKTVAPGQTIASEWGNLVWDQSTQNFATTADRNTQWPAPLDGAICYTAAEKTWWVRVGGVWKPCFNDWPSPPVWRSVRTTTDVNPGGVWGVACSLQILSAPPGTYLAQGTALVGAAAGNSFVGIRVANVDLPKAAYYSSQALNNVWHALPIAGELSNHPGGTLDWSLQFGFSGGGAVTIYIGSYLQVTYTGPN